MWSIYNLIQLSKYSFTIQPFAGNLDCGWRLQSEEMMRPAINLLPSKFESTD
ncbi:hypothetical protein PILCRDRAFT_820048 [Piloderma croceum F 1598]|uniref:Uncharacterized protein n=1 Tax=Piloderma croceum (strain F 1598) TaxID=765440 RepID=A0A0C3BZF4_PILCF|nr:hypothetical protein PILCRDRAFT_820048 [Piloderma croceum F 1598]